MFDESISVCKNSLVRHGENVTAYCNLSTIYELKEDVQKSEYYYRKALENRKGERTEAYKIATCAIEREDHLMVKDCIEKILEERPYDTSMRFFGSIAYVNLGEYQKALEQIYSVYRIAPEDAVIKYYVNFISQLEKGDNNCEKLLPLKYIRELPEKIEKKRIRKIKELVKEPQKITVALKNPEIKNIIEW